MVAVPFRHFPSLSDAIKYKKVLNFPILKFFPAKFSPCFKSSANMPWIFQFLLVKTTNCWIFLQICPGFFVACLLSGHFVSFYIQYLSIIYLTSLFWNFSRRNFTPYFCPAISLSLFIARAARDWLFLGFSSEDGHVMGRFKTRLWRKGPSRLSRDHPWRYYYITFL